MPQSRFFTPSKCKKILESVDQFYSRRSSSIMDFESLSVPYCNVSFKLSILFGQADPYIVFSLFSTNLENFRFSDSFSSREPMIKKEKSDHPETFFNRFLMLKLVYGMIFDQFRTFSIFGLFFIKGADDPEREVGSF